VKPPRPRVNRRDLFRLRTAARSLRAPEGAGGQPGGDGAPGSATDLIRARRAAMATCFEVRLGARVPGAVELASRALDLIDALEAQLTVYRTDSEVSRLNATGHLGPVVVEPGLFALLETAQRLGDETGGAYDVTTGALSQAWGFVKGPRRVPDPETLADARARTGRHLLRLDPASKTVALERPGVLINLGSIGKGYAVDRAVALIRDHWWPTTALVHGGRSSLYSLGSPPGRFGSRWEVALRNPFRPDTPLGTLHLRNRGLGFSGTDFQKFEVDGRDYGHILDPRTGEPARGPAGVTVLAPTAAVADALSTAFFLLGRDAAAGYVQTHPEIAAVFVESGPADGSPRVTTLGLSVSDFDRGTG
jgi:thiamine biosynthesis lipoprotein